MKTYTSMGKYGKHSFYGRFICLDAHPLSLSLDTIDTPALNRPHLVESTVVAM